MRGSVTIYGVALVALIAAVLLRWPLDPLMGDALPLVTVVRRGRRRCLGRRLPAGHRQHHPRICRLLPICSSNLAACSALAASRPPSVWSPTSSPAYSSSGSARPCGSRRTVPPSAESCSGSRCGSIGDAVITTDVESRRHLPECRRRVIDGLESARCAGSATRHRLSDHQRRHPSAG